MMKAPLTPLGSGTRPVSALCAQLAVEDTCQPTDLLTYLLTYLLLAPKQPTRRPEEAEALPAATAELWQLLHARLQQALERQADCGESSSEASAAAGEPTSVAAAAPAEAAAEEEAEVDSTAVTGPVTGSKRKRRPETAEAEAEAGALAPSPET